jgi:hypothetical protein
MLLLSSFASDRGLNSKSCSAVEKRLSLGKLLRERSASRHTDYRIPTPEAPDTRFNHIYMENNILVLQLLLTCSCNPQAAEKRDMPDIIRALLYNPLRPG